MAKKKLNVLLVEPPYRAVHLPFGLQKISTYHLKRGDKVTFIHDHPKNVFTFSKKPHFHRIYVTSVFTYNGKIVVNTVKYLQRLFPDSRIMIGGIFATLMPDYVEQETGITPWTGLYPKVEDLKPDYSIFPLGKQACCITSRGCVRNCEFCAVSDLEPGFSLEVKWREQILAGYEAGLRHLNIQDNNYLANPYSHQKEVTEFLLKFPDMTIDFNQAIDCRLFTDKKAKLMAKLKIPVLRFAFDGMQSDKYFQKACRLAKKLKVGKDITSYTLYNFDDTPEDFWYRLNEIFKSGTNAFPMKYVPLDALDKSFIGKHWTRSMLKNFQQLMRKWSTTGATLSHRGHKKWKNHRIGRTAEEFVEMLNAPRISSKHFVDLRSSDRARSTGFGLTDRSEIEDSLERNVKIGVLDKKGKRKGRRTMGRNIKYK